MHACPRFVHPGAGRSTATPVTLGRKVSRSAEIELPDLLDPSLREAPSTCAGCSWLASCGGGCTLISQQGLDDVVPQTDPHCDTHMLVHDRLFDRVIPSFLAGRHRGAKAFNGATVHTSDLAGALAGSVPVR